MEDNEQDQPQMLRIPIDGSYGAGPLAEVTINTKDGDRDKEETFTIPYMLVDEKVLWALNKMNLILGYRIVKEAKFNPLKELGL